jgi:starch synthase
MDILLVAAELAPYAGATQAAETVQSLAKALRQLGHDVTLALPRYPGFEAQGLMAARRLTPLSLDGGGEVHVFDAQLASGAKLVLFDAPALFERAGIYGEGPEDYEDNVRRFGFLARATIALILARAEQGSRFDIVHVHDWPGALVPMHLSNAPIAPLPTVLSIHDITRQGALPAKDADGLGLPKEMLEGLKLGNKLNVIKGALPFVDAVTLPSDRYAQELLNPDRVGSLAQMVQNTKTPVVGITGGVDYSFYNPATDSWISARYDAEDPSNKPRNKTALLRDFGLSLDLARPLVVVLGPLEKTRGADLLVQALPALAKREISMLICGKEPQFSEQLSAIAERYPESVVFVPDLSEALLHKALAGGDFLLSPAREDATGHRLQCAQRYGTLPIAAAVDAAPDVIVDCDAELETGTGILFDSLTKTGLSAAVQRAEALFSSERYPVLVRRMMRRDLGWERPSRRYVHVYRQALATKS